MFFLALILFEVKLETLLLILIDSPVVMLAGEKSLDHRL
jgi:hypothetical protein